LDDWIEVGPTQWGSKVRRQEGSSIHFLLIFFSFLFLFPFLLLSLFFLLSFIHNHKILERLIRAAAACGFIYEALQGIILAFSGRYTLEWVLK
jgi:hypothetical protein